MRLLAISDTYIPASFMRDGLAPLATSGVEVVVRHWDHATLVELQEDNLRIEQGGPEAVRLSDALTSDVDSFDMIIVQFAPIGRAVIEAAGRLKLIGVLRGGTENVDVALATQRGICVMNTPGRLARAVAECTVGLILAEIRNLARAHALLRAGVWSRDFPNSQEIPELGGRTVGLVGYGAIAQLVARFLHAFDCRLLACDPYFEGDPTPATLTDLDTLLRESDVVSLHARLSPETEGLIDGPRFAMMKPTAVLVNTARSGLVDESALLEALARRTIRGAALDVFDEEPLPPGHPLLALDNVTITPHLAGSTADGFRNSPKRMAAFLARLLRGEQATLPIVNGVAPVLGS